MYRCHPLHLAITLSILMILALPSHAEWIDGGNPISPAPAGGDVPVVVTDGAGGAIVTFTDPNGLYAQRFDGYGSVVWTSGNAVLSLAAGNINSTIAVSDGAGGAIVAWSDTRSGPTNRNIYAQRVDANGGVLWQTDGMPVCTAVGNAITPTIVTDGAGGAIIAWRDARAGVDIYAQRVDATGDTLWTFDGIPVCLATSTQEEPVSVSDGTGGTIVVWRDGRAGGANTDIYAQRIDGAGNPVWTPDGRPVSTDLAFQWTPCVVPDGESGAIVAWRDERNAYNDIYAQRVDQYGLRMWDNDVPICALADYAGTPLAVSDETGGMITVWRDGRNPGSNYDLYTQRVSAEGFVLWTVDGVAVSTVPGYDDDKIQAQPVSDGAGGMIVVWEDWRRVDTTGDIYGQRIDRDGNTRWQTGGAPVCAEPRDQYAPAVILNDQGDALVAWTDWRNPIGAEIYAQRVGVQRGNWGHVAGTIAAVKDVAADQGARVMVEWSASRLDAFEVRTVTHYSVWRAVDRFPAGAASAVMVELSEVGREFGDGTGRVTRAGGSDYYWQWMGNVDAMYFPGYAFTAPTLGDSMAGNDAWQYFQVVTHTSDSYEFWVSPPDSGYSVDNLSPSSPQNVAAYYDNVSGTMSLWWSSNAEDDLSHYHVYRGSGPDFVPSDANRIAAVTDTVTSGHPYPPQQPWHYKFSAVDVHGNESVHAILAPGDIETPTLVAGYNAAWDGEAVEVSWRLADVEGTPGFEVYRKTTDGAEYRPLRVAVFATDERYYFRDATVTRGRSYTYRVTITGDEAEAASFEATVSVPTAKLTLYQNYPNPFRPKTTIGFELPVAARVELTVYDVGGRRVATLVRGMRGAGYHEVPFETGGEPGTGGLASGVYFYKLNAGKATVVRKLTILK